MHGRGDIVIATSIPPSISRQDNGVEVGDTYQRNCVESWATAGLRVISINAREEIAALSRRYPDVEFIAVDRDAKALSGRPTPFLSDVLDVLAQQPVPIAGIINADIYLQPARNWRRSITRALDHQSILIARRHDVSTLTETKAKPVAAGFDCFFFKRDWIPGIARYRFALGLPWWDYWLPMAFAFKGIETALLEESPALHLAHPMAYNNEIWNVMASEFVDFVVSDAAQSTWDPHHRFAPIVAYCRSLSGGDQPVPLAASAGGNPASARGWLSAWRDRPRSPVEEKPSVKQLASMCFAALLRSAKV